MTIPSGTKVDWDQYVADLMAFSVAIEKEDTKSYKNELNSNVITENQIRNWLIQFWVFQLLRKVLFQLSFGITCQMTRRPSSLRRNERWLTMTMLRSRPIQSIRMTKAEG